MESTPSSTNKLENWIAARFANEKDVMDVLQEYGVISDNSVWAKDVGNDREAMMWMAKNFEHYCRHGV
jgi:glutamate dehydrogenase/leucine dehydrogenase